MHDASTRGDARRDQSFGENTIQDQAQQVLQAWTWPSEPSISVNRDGLINQTFVVASRGTRIAVLQRLNTRIFVPEVHEDIEAVTTQLAAANLPTPRLLRTNDGHLWHTEHDGSVWRCMSFEGDRTIHSIESLRDAYETAALVARFHSAVFSLAWEFRSVREDAHNTAKHIKQMVVALDTHQAHRLREQVARVAEQVLSQWEKWSGPDDLPRRVVHGDLKVSNVRFLGSNAHCLIDLDTMARSTLDIELGDAMRSWCNPASEEANDARFDLRIFSTVMQGYADGFRTSKGCASPGSPCAQEWQAIVPGIERVSLELAARFARDALEERYFGWDARFGSHGDHCLVRARGQAALARSVRSVASEAEQVVRSVAGASLS